MKNKSDFFRKTAFSFAAIGVALVVGAVAPTPAKAAAEQINCPLPQARRTITDTLPNGWWTTPAVNRLSGTRVANIGGRPALICEYGTSGSVQRNAPEGANCSASGGGFTCTSPGVVAGNPGTYTTGPLVIPQTWAADLDRGTVGRGDEDIWFQAETADLLYLAPRNGAQIGVGNRRNRGYSGCASARFSTSRVSLRDIPTGSYVCVRTSQGRVSQFRVNELRGGSPKTLVLGYTTWNN